MRIYTLRELKESKLLYDKKIPPFGLIITVLTTIFVLSAILWAALSPKTYVVKANGIVSDYNKVNIMNTVSGKVDEIFVTEGQKVETGDKILKIDSFQLELQIVQINSVVELYNQKIDLIKDLIGFVNQYKLDDLTTQSNPFEESDINTSQVYAIANNFITYIDEQTAQKEMLGDTYSQDELDNIKTTFLVQQSVFSMLEQYNLEKIQQQTQLKMYQNGLEEYTLRAECSGIVHIQSALTTGIVLNAGTLIGNISTGKKENLFIISSVSATERSKFKVSDEVEIAISGVSQTEFGVLKGSVMDIDTDSTQTENGQVYYSVKISLENTTLVKKNQEIDVVNGMIGECRIKYDETTWLKWMIEQIGIKFN